ncbi:MAG: FkbM family methyltransferase [Chloroflexi bacterium]|nr:FkbM family methyltransferase [Chloroflexota bacterium]
MATITYHPLRVNPQISFDIAVWQDHHDPIGQAIGNQAYFFPEPFRVLFPLLRSGANVLDVGAHIGTFSLAAAALGCNVLAVEASLANATLLSASIQRNHFDQMQVFNVAASDRAGELEFVEGGPFGFVANALNSSPTITVKATTLTSLVAEAGWTHIDYMKLDVEGSEVTALHGMEQLLLRDDAPLVLFESNGHTLNFFQETPQSLIGLLTTYGYSVYNPEQGELRPVEAGDFQPECLVDYIAFKRRPDALKNWRQGSPMTHEQIIVKTLEECVSSNADNRAYVARALRKADKRIALELRVMQALNDLRHDSDANVRLEANQTWREFHGQQQLMQTIDDRLLAATERLKALNQQADVMLHSYTIRSNVPVFGKVIAWVRRNATSHLREPYLDRMVERQVQVNRQIVGELRAVIQLQQELFQIMTDITRSTVAAVDRSD